MSESDDRVRRLVRWNSADTAAVLSQTNDRIEKYMREGKTVGIVVCIVSSNEDGSEKLYEPAFSRMPIECALWASHKIERQAVSAAEEV
jgi:hypothetical protein